MAASLAQFDDKSTWYAGQKNAAWVIRLLGREGPHSNGTHLAITVPLPTP